MEWSKYTDFHSTEGACSDGQTQVYHPGTYYVRYRQTSTYNAGTNYATVIVPDFGGAATYTVSFEANGGTGTMADVTNVSGDYVLPANGFTPPANKQFKAWNVGGNEKAVGDTINVTANTTVTAVWEDIPVVTYTVSFNANGGANTMADVNGISGEYTLPACTFTAPDGQQFKAWAIGNVGGEQKLPGEKITVNVDTVIYAIWEAIPVTTYTVSFEANGGTGTMADVNGIAGTYYLPANGFTAPDGRQFKAWSVGGDEKAVGAAIT
ncbi:MAG: InlB B-repeat-containing protein, partial [Clostridia bacterium]|nr:InlB B-repeat-containing protein [Clostridia bacterium]